MNNFEFEKEVEDLLSELTARQIAEKYVKARINERKNVYNFLTEFKRQDDEISTLKEKLDNAER